MKVEQPAAATQSTKSASACLAILIVDADAAFHGHGNRHGGLHGDDAIGDEARLGHQTGAEAPAWTRLDGQPQLRLISR